MLEFGYRNEKKNSKWSEFHIISNQHDTFLNWYSSWNFVSKDLFGLMKNKLVFQIWLKLVSDEKKDRSGESSKKLLEKEIKNKQMGSPGLICIQN